MIIAHLRFQELNSAIIISSFRRIIFFLCLRNGFLEFFQVLSCIVCECRRNAGADNTEAESQC